MVLTLEFSTLLWLDSERTRVNISVSRGDNWDYDTPMTSRSISFDSYGICTCFLYLFIGYKTDFWWFYLHNLMVNYIPVLNDDMRSLEESLEMLRNTQEASWCFAPQSSMAKEIQGYFDSFGKKNTFSLGIVWANPHESTNFGCRWMQQIHRSSRF